MSQDQSVPTEQGWSRSTVVGAAVLFGLAVRLLAGWISDLTRDEAFTYFISTLPFLQLVDSVRVDPHPPGIYLVTTLISGWSRSELFLRLPSLITGALCPYLIYRLARELKMEREGVWLSWLLALNWLLATQQARMRMYGLVTFFSLIAMELFLRQRGEQPRSQAERWLFALAVMLVPWFHLFGFGLIGLFFLLSWNKKWVSTWYRVWSWLSLGTACLWIEVVRRSASIKQQIDAQGAAVQAQPRSPLTFPSELLGLDFPVLLSSQSDSGWWTFTTWTVGILFWGACVMGVVRLWKDDRMAALLFGGFCLVPPLMLLIYSFWETRYNQPRYFIYFFPAYLLMVFRAQPKVGRLVTPALLILNTILLGMLVNTPELRSQNWQMVAKKLEQQATPNDFILVYDPYSIVALSFYYHEGKIKFESTGSTKGRMNLPPGAVPLTPLIPAHLGPELEKHLGNARIFLVLSQERSQAVRVWFSQRYHVVDAYEEPSLAHSGRVSLYTLQKREP